MKINALKFGRTSKLFVYLSRSNEGATLNKTIMTRLKRLESKGYKVVNYMSGNGCEATKDNVRLPTDNLFND